MEKISRKLPRFIVADYYVVTGIMTTPWKNDGTKRSKRGISRQVDQGLIASKVTWLHRKSLRKPSSIEKGLGPILHHIRTVSGRCGHLYSSRKFDSMNILCREYEEASIESLTRRNLFNFLCAVSTPFPCEPTPFPRASSTRPTRKFDKWRSHCDKTEKQRPWNWIRVQMMFLLDGKHCCVTITE